MKLALLSSLLLSAPASCGALELPASAPELSFSDCCEAKMEKGADGSSFVRFSRPGSSPSGYQFDNPGARVRFMTDAPRSLVKLRYNELHSSSTARNSIGLCLVDGKRISTFETKQRGVKREPELAEVVFSSPSPGFHLYELVMPYGDSVDVLGASFQDGSKFAPPPPRPKIRCAFYGDSVTQGFTASSTAGTWPFLLAEELGFQAVNFAIAGRSSSAADGALLGSSGCQIAFVCIGVNDWQGGVPPETLKRNMQGFLKNLRALDASMELYIVTPLWVDDSWRPAKAVAPLAEFRRAVAEAVAEAGGPRTRLVDGPSLIDHDKTFFDAVLVHPNDAGFKQMAGRLAKIVKETSSCK